MIVRPTARRAAALLGGRSLSIAAVLLCAGSALASDADEAAQHRFFEAKVRPLLAERCFACHGEEKQEGDLRLDARGHLLAGGWSGPAVTPGDVAGSVLLEAVRYETYEMPPTGKLPAEEIAVLEEWVRLGAPWPGGEDTPAVRPASGPTFSDEDRAWWALQPVADPPVPVVDLEWGRNGIDRFILSALSERGLEPAPEADRVTLIRRLSQDLLGLPPTPEQIDAFVADDRPDAYERLVDRYLASGDYGRRWARHWLDLVRYADSDGYRNDHRRPHAWRYRDYVVDRLNDDVPYDRFVREQLAADEFYPDDPAALTALGYLRAGIYEHNSRDAVGQRELMLNELTDTTADVFLGLGLQCAKCHDHKFDPLRQTDYYRLRAYFEPLLFRDGVVAATPAEIAAHEAASAEWTAATAELRAELEVLEAPPRERARKQAVGKFPAGEQASYLKPDGEKTAFDWQIHWLIQDQVRQEWDKIENGSYIPPKHKPRWTELRKAIAAFDHLKPAPLPVVRTAGDAAGAIPPTVVPKRKTEVAPAPIALLAEEPPAIPAPADLPSSGRRAALADWIADPANPLSTRVIVNRVWKSHFGRGLAPNGSDFGVLGGPPSHPELLDWLVGRFLDEGWRLKPLHRLIVTSATYRQSAVHPRRRELSAIDPRNDWYWRADVRRLDAEQVRDALLTVTGALTPRDGGPGAGHAAPVRSLYLAVIRNRREALMDLFDLPQFFVSAAARDTTTSPLQSLYLINSEASLKHAAALAQRAVAETPGGAPADRVRRAWRLTAGREPTDEEVALGVRFLAAQAERLDVSPPMRSGAAGLGFGVLPTRDSRAVDLAPERPSPLRVPHAAFAGTEALDLGPGGFSVEAFFLARSVYRSGSVRTVVSKWGGDRRGGWMFGVTGEGSRRKPQTLVMQLFGDGPGGPATEAAIFSDQHVALDTPYYAAASVTPATAAAPGSVTFYLKDLADDDATVSIVTKPLALTGGAGNAAAVAIGRRGTERGALFDGLIDAVRLTAGPLAEADTLLIDEADGPRTLAHWRFEEEPGADGTPGVLRDSSGAGRRLVAEAPAAATRAPAGQALADFCHALLNSSEFLYVP